MSQTNLMKLGPVGDVVELPAFGRSVVVGFVDGLVLRERTASKKLREDRTINKVIYRINYELAEEATVVRLLYLYSLGVELQYEFTHLSETVVKTVLMSPFSRERLLAVNGGLWAGVSFELEEV